MRVFTLVVVLLVAHTAFSQHTFTAVIKNTETAEPLPGATIQVKGTSIGTIANEQGVALLENIPAGKQTILVRFVGFRERTVTLLFPFEQTGAYEILLSPEEEELEEITIQSTRSSRTFQNIPTRVEFIAGEELEEKGNMKPGDIRMLLSESTGIQTQQTSATSANASIRIQGLDGRYTQILKDGFPLYAGFAGGLGLLQTPPLDLRQVEVIKGSSSTLYGGGAIAGLVNLISKEPGDEREVRLLANITSANGADLSGFYGERYGKLGTTLYAGYNRNGPYDPADIGLTAIPKFQRFTINPKFFFNPDDKTSIIAGINAMTETRTGGDVQAIQGNGNAIHRYFEKNLSDRLSTQLSFTRQLFTTGRLTFKNSANYFNRLLTTPDHTFEGMQYNTFSEVNYTFEHGNMEWIGGVNLWTESFSEEQHGNMPLRNYRQRTTGAFVQNTWETASWLSLETGFRADHVRDYGWVWLPRISALFRISPALTSRLGGGFGYKQPSIFTEESERILYRNLLPMEVSRQQLEQSYGANFDINYKTVLADGRIGLNINQLFFYTRLDHPLTLTERHGDYQLTNAAGHIDTKGLETNIKVDYEDFKLFLGYTLTDARLHYGRSAVQNPLTARHRVNSVLMYELEERWKAGLEAYYFSRQRLTDDTFGKPYWICGFMVEKLWENFSVFINFENFLDARQTRFDTIYTGNISDPVFRDIYAPLDGFVINGGVKVRL